MDKCKRLNSKNIWFQDHPRKTIDQRFRTAVLHSGKKKKVTPKLYYNRMSQAAKMYVTKVKINIIS